MQLIAWVDLARLATESNTYWLVFKIPRDPQTWRIGIFVTPRMNLPPKIRGDEFAVNCRQSANMTLSRKIPGLAVLKVLLLAIKSNQLEVQLVLPHVQIMKYQAVTRVSTVRLADLVEMFAVLVWLWGPPNLL
jgi:hypothetical protein